MAMASFKQSGRLSRFIMRRDRMRIPLWLIGIVFFTLIVPPALNELYGKQDQRDVMANTMNNPAMVAMVGPADLSNYTLGVMTAHQMLLVTAVVVGLMSILLVSRHTRGDEENGRLELIRALPVGRVASLHAPILVYTGIYILLAVLVGFGLYALKLESMDLAGSLLYGATLGATGIFFMAITALFAQTCETSRAMIGFSIAALLVFYLGRAITDVTNEAMSWASPLGWVTKTEVYGTNNWWAIVLMLGAALILLIVAYVLQMNRDMERGFLPSKPGRKHASSFLQSPLGLGLKLQRTGIISWAIGMLVLGASYGSVFGDLDSFFAGNEMMMQMLASGEGHSLVEQFIPMLMIIMAIVATIPPVMAMNKLYTEEKKGRLEHLLSKPVSRTELMGSFLVIALINGFIMLSCTAIGLWAAQTAVMEKPFTFAMIYGMALTYYPAILVMISVSVLLIGFLPRMTSLIWLYVFFSFVTVYMGGLFQFADWVGNLSPFGPIPELPIEEMNWMPVLVLTGIAVVLMGAGFIGYRRRDMEG